MQHIIDAFRKPEAEPPQRTDPVVSHARDECPTLTIRDRVRNGTRRFSFDIKPRDAKNAVPRDVCRCTLANAVKRATGAPFAAVHCSVLYLLERCEDGTDEWEVVKYEHDRADIVRALDEGFPLFKGTVTLRPPCPSRSFGVQTAAQKAALPGTKTQTAEHRANKSKAARASAAHRRRSHPRPNE